MPEDTDSRYAASDTESYQPGSDDTVLVNKLSITSVHDIETRESILLQKIYEQALTQYTEEHCFTAKDIRQLHHLWLHPIYAWAGQYRTVNLSKEGFIFAAAHLIPKLMKTFEKTVLRIHT